MIHAGMTVRPPRCGRGLTRGGFTARRPGSRPSGDGLTCPAAPADHVPPPRGFPSALPARASAAVFLKSPIRIPRDLPGVAVGIGDAAAGGTSTREEGPCWPWASGTTAPAGALPPDGGSARPVPLAEVAAEQAGLERAQPAGEQVARGGHAAEQEAVRNGDGGRPFGCGRSSPSACCRGVPAPAHGSAPPSSSVRIWAVVTWRQ
jgi:hypothetical protein